MLKDRHEKRRIIFPFLFHCPSISLFLFLLHFPPSPAAFFYPNPERGGGQLYTNLENIDYHFLGIWHKHLLGILYCLNQSLATKELRVPGVTLN